MTTITLPSDLFQELSLAAQNFGLSIEMYLRTIAQKDAIAHEKEPSLSETEWQNILTSYKEFKQDKSIIINTDESIEQYL
jgi:hypothetical protein